MIDWWLDLSRISWSDPRSALGWQYPQPSWVWIMIAVAALIFGAWSYRRLIGSRAARTLLTVLRTLLIIWLAVLLAGPVLVVARERVDPDWLLILVDRSASMRIEDATVNGSPASRDEQLRTALNRHASAFGDEQLGRDRHVAWLGFDEGVFDVSPQSLPDAAGKVTNLRTAIEQALRRASGHPVSAVVVMTDGRSPQPTGADLVRHLSKQAVPVFAVPLGAQQTLLDFAVEQIDAPDKAFVNDTVPVTVFLNRYPADATIDPAAVTVKLVDPQTGRVLDRKHPTDAQLKEPVRLSTESALVGAVKWRVEVEYQSPDAGRELITENNSRDMVIELVDRPIHVLYIDGYPRWEYRYLKNMLVREKSIRSSVLLLSADRDFAQEGDVAITRMPNTTEEMKPYDVIIIGDVPAGYFTPEQLVLIREQVATHGAGLLWIAGAQATPRSFDATELAGLLPMRRPAAVEPLPLSAEGLNPQPTELARVLSILRLRSSSMEEQTQDWPQYLPPLRWAQDLGELKPTAEVLADAPFDTRRVPLVTRMNFGAGQIIYVGTDETWRWRYGRGELYFEQAWTQLIRMLGRGRIQQDNQRVRMTVSNRRANLDQPIVVSLTVEDPLLIRRHLPRIAVTVRDADNEQSPALEQIELRPAGDSDSDTPRYEAVWRPIHTGRLSLRVSEPALDDLGITQIVEVVHPDDELRHPVPDHPRLAALASDTGGAVVSPDKLDELLSLVPNRARRTPDDIREPLWDSRLSLGVFLLLLTLEWVGRKLIRLA